MVGREGSGKEGSMKKDELTNGACPDLLGQEWITRLGAEHRVVLHKHGPGRGGLGA